TQHTDITTARCRCDGTSSLPSRGEAEPIRWEIVTATRDPRADSPDTTRRVRWDERPIAGPWRGLPWWAAVLTGFGLAALGAIIDIAINGEIGWLFQTCYVIGSVAAIAAVHRGSLFGPMVQPPLIIGIIVPAIVLATSGTPTGGGMMSRVLTVGRPLINAFPTMAITTGVVVLIGSARLYRERDPERSRGSGAGTSRSPRGKPSEKKPTGSSNSERSGTNRAGSQRTARSAAPREERAQPQRADRSRSGREKPRAQQDVTASDRRRPSSERPAP